VQARYDVRGERVRQAQVEQDDVGSLRRAGPLGLRGTGGVADDVDVAVAPQRGHDTVADHRMVVDHEHPDDARPQHGSSSRHVVPPCGSGTTRSVPPSLRTASVLVDRPIPGV
jgi:hypothetical protein